MKKYKMVIKNKNGNEIVCKSNNLEYIRKRYKGYFHTGNDMNTRILDCTVEFYKDGYQVDYLF